VRDWPYSSFHRDVGAAAFPVDWGGDIEAIGKFGERWDLKPISHAGLPSGMADCAFGSNPSYPLRPISW
jgi:hypothetical protein